MKVNKLRQLSNVVKSLTDSTQLSFYTKNISCDFNGLCGFSPTVIFNNPNPSRDLYQPRFLNEYGNEMDYLVVENSRYRLLIAGSEYPKSESGELVPRTFLVPLFQRIDEFLGFRFKPLDEYFLLNIRLEVLGFPVEVYHDSIIENIPEDVNIGEPLSLPFSAVLEEVIHHFVEFLASQDEWPESQYIDYGINLKGKYIEAKTIGHWGEIRQNARFYYGIPTAEDDSAVVASQI